ncbi:MAG: tol-pal system-associated acyl-CoA thioesterase [Gammaproteobacteria bacterium]|nr:tol-pal system-associated acyl-CoA thioesterase [Gammaproteobacteria bacterium]
MTDVFSIPVRIYYEDTDTGGVVYYANYLRFMERARTELLRSRGLEQDVLRDECGVLFAVRRAEVDYLKPAKLDDELKVTAEIRRLGGASINFYQEVRLGEDVLCKGNIRIACIHDEALAPMAVPKRVTELLQPVVRRAPDGGEQ